MKAITFVFDVYYGVSEFWAKGILADSLIEGWKTFVEEEENKLDAEERGPLKEAHETYIGQLNLIVVIDTITGETTQYNKYGEINYYTEIREFIDKL
jgi:hypothetical protein